METMDVKPSLASSSVGYKNEVDWPLGGSEGVGGDGRLWGCPLYPSDAAAEYKGVEHGCTLRMYKITISIIAL